MRMRWVLVAVLGLAVGQAFACMREQADRRAVQWSTLIVHGKLLNVTDADQHRQSYQFSVDDVVDGKPPTGGKIEVFNVPAAEGKPDCAKLSADDVGKHYLLLLRETSQAPEAQAGKFWVVTIAVRDPADPESAEAIKELVAEVRKDEASLTDDQIKAQVSAFVDAQDDTEADQAEQAIEDMGPRAVPALKQAAKSANEVAKSQLAKLIAELSPPLPARAPTSQPAPG